MKRTLLLIASAITIAACAETPQAIKGRSESPQWWFSSDSSAIVIDARNANITTGARLAVVIEYRTGERDSLMFRQVTSPLVVNVHSPRIATVKFWQVHPSVVAKAVEIVTVSIFMVAGLILASALLFR